MSFPGSSVAVKEYIDSEDFEGTLQQQYEGALAFIMRNLFKEQKGKSVNTTGIPEIPQSVFEELLVNAFVHSTAMRAIQKLKEYGFIKRKGGKKGGYWEIL